MIFGRMGRLAVLLVVPVAVILGSCGLAKHTPPPSGMGHEVIDGHFAFIVTQLNTSPTFDRTHAQGVYEIVSMAVRNLGSEAQFFEWAAQKLKDGAGREYSASLMVPHLLGDVVNSVEPGQQVSLRLAFDVPPGTKPTQIVLHDSLSSHGVAVSLRQSPSHSSSPAPSPSPAVNGG